MGNKYTVEAGIGNMVGLHQGTEYLIVALWWFWQVKIDHKTLYWKQLKIC